MYVRDKYKDNIFMAETRSDVAGFNGMQRFNVYHVNKTGKFVTRFYVDDYYPTGTKLDQLTGKGCSHETRDGAIAHGIEVSSLLRVPRNTSNIKNVLTGLKRGSL